MKWLIFVKNIAVVIYKSITSGETEIVRESSKLPTAPEPSRPVGDRPLTVKRVALIIGHAKNDGGASGNGITEYPYNSWCAEFAKSKVSSKIVETFYRGSTGILGVAASAIGWKPDIVIELHLNSATATAKGCEVLIKKGDHVSDYYAKLFAVDFCKKFNRVMRRGDGSFDLVPSDRGYTSLKALTAAPAEMLVEPFFVSNKNEILPKEDYGNFLVEFIEKL